jgi:hypothetical protein
MPKSADLDADLHKLKARDLKRTLGFFDLDKLRRDCQANVQQRGKSDKLQSGIPLNVLNWKPGGFRYNSTGIPDFEKHFNDTKDSFYEREKFFSIERKVFEGSVEEALFEKSREMLE